MKKIIVIVTSILLVTCISLNIRHNYNKPIETNTKIAMYLLDGPNGNVTRNINNIESNYILDTTRTTCTGASGVTGTVTMTDHILSLNTNGPVKCNVYFYEEIETYDGDLVYLCPDGSYQNSQSCIKPNVTNIITYITPCNCSTTTYSCPDGGTYHATWTQCYGQNPTTRNNICLKDVCNTWSISGWQYCNEDILSKDEPCNFFTKPATASQSCTYGSTTNTQTNTEMNCPDGYNRGTITTTGTYTAPTGSCSSANTGNVTQSATCTANGVRKYYCSTSNTYQDDITCYK